MKINNDQKQYIINKLSSIEDILAEKYNGLFLNDELIDMIKCEVKEMLNRYIRNMFEIEDPEYDIRINNKNGLVFTIIFE